MVANVPNRSGIVIHPGNHVGHTQGCILLGSEVGKLIGDRAVLNSGNTFNKFIEQTKEQEELHLTIKEVF